ncbi:MAG: ECF transporter S component [Ruminococcaceae bacterium]|nr:ECF transporter S component [Oscillospiraceae bacterium]
MSNHIQEDIIMKKQNLPLRTITKIAILAAVAVVLMLFQIPVWFAPSFYEIDLSDAVILMGGFAMGPLAAAIMELIKNLLNLLINGTMTAGVGELANFVMGCALVVPTSWFYKHHKSFKGAVLSLVIGICSLLVVSSAVNYFVMIPAYVYFMGFKLESIVGMASAVNSNVDSLATLILFATVPFNLLKGVICATVNLLLYKRLSKVLHL